MLKTQEGPERPFYQESVQTPDKMKLSLSFLVKVKGSVHQNSADVTSTEHIYFEDFTDSQNVL